MANCWMSLFISVENLFLNALIPVWNKMITTIYINKQHSVVCVEHIFKRQLRLPVDKSLNFDLFSIRCRMITQHLFKVHTHLNNWFLVFFSVPMTCTMIYVLFNLGFPAHTWWMLKPTKLCLISSCNSILLWSFFGLNRKQFLDNFSNKYPDITLFTVSV